ncbi:MAG: hypothetical protein IIT46_08400 [Lachnospiraceae bacterium]|jgi:hypothetical protein|nr:hypothetical protein [Lachnospiraceae bacterium]MBQ5559783.1 hypothetical protein [Lachnospiraceae bacterium]MBQ9808842.1 hypothetical protein [Ruminococcus sp.]MCR4803080.1 hypothetical protein [Lachnospiraceae bacterium]
MENYKLIDMFDKLDAAVLEDLHLEKDLKRQQNLIRKLFARGHINIARMIAAIGLTITGILVIVIRVRRYRRRVA